MRARLREQDERRPTVAEPAAKAQLVAVEPAPRPGAAQRRGRQDRRRDARAGGASHCRAEIVRVASLHVRAGRMRAATAGSDRGAVAAAAAACVTQMTIE